MLSFGASLILCISHRNDVGLFCLFLTNISQTIDCFWDVEGFVIRQSLYMLVDLAAVHTFVIYTDKLDVLSVVACIWQLLSFGAVYHFRATDIQLEEQAKVALPSQFATDVEVAVVVPEDCECFDVPVATAHV
jgi:hypothetical protein